MTTERPAFRQECDFYPRSTMSRRDDEFTVFVEKHRQQLLRAAYATTGGWAQAEDVVQIALVKLYQAWPRVDDSRGAGRGGGRWSATGCPSGRRLTGPSRCPTASISWRPFGSCRDVSGR